MASSLGGDLRDAGFRGELSAETPLAPMTTWRIGGPAELLAAPKDADDVILALRWASARGVSRRVLGNGSNLLVSDAGVRGLVLRIRRALDDVAFIGANVVAGAGVSFPALAHAAAERGLSGLEFGGGIPGCVGGAIVMNAGWHEFEVGNVVRSVRHVDRDGVVTVRDHAACRFAYRSSAFRGKGGAVLSAELALTEDAKPAVKERLLRFSESRKEHQPTELPSCGSVFLKPEGDFAGRLIEAAGLKGRRIGSVQVSPKHANFFVNLGGGTAVDALALVELVEREVFEKFAVTLTREFEYWD